MAEPIETPPGYTAALVFDDPTPNAIILNRINRCAVEITGSCTNLNHEECNDFLDLVMLISRKIVSVWRHLQEQELGKAMDAIWSNFFHVVEDFIMLALHFRVLDEKFSMFRREEPLSSTTSSWAVLTKADGDALIKKLGATPV